jgi:hypothetical protein
MSEESKRDLAEKIAEHLIEVFGPFEITQTNGLKFNASIRSVANEIVGFFEEVK